MLLFTHLELNYISTGGDVPQSDLIYCSPQNTTLSSEEEEEEEGEAHFVYH